MLRRTILSVMGAISLACSSSHSEGGATSSLSSLPSPWEQKLNTHYTHYGVATIEHVGTRYVLSLDCGGVHDVYVSSTPDVQLDAYLGAPLRAHYVYETRVNPNIRCVQSPCTPVQERIAIIRQVERLTEAETRAARAERECSLH